MNKAFALAVLMSAAALGTAHAREMTAPQRDVNVVFVNPDEHHENKMLAVPETVLDPTRSQINRAQADIRRDPGLRAALIRDNVELRNVTGVESDNAGGTTVYVR